MSAMFVLSFVCTPSKGKIAMAKDKAKVEENVSNREEQKAPVSLTPQQMADLAHLFQRAQVAKVEVAELESNVDTLRKAYSGYCEQIHKLIGMQELELDDGSKWSVMPGKSSYHLRENKPTDALKLSLKK